MQYEKPSADELAIRFEFHPPKGNQGEKYEQIRKRAREFARVIVDLTPASAEQAKALDALDQAVFLSNAAIARRE